MGAPHTTCTTTMVGATEIEELVDTIIREVMDMVTTAVADMTVVQAMETVTGYVKVHPINKATGLPERR